MRIQVARSAGYCFGVRRAVDMAMGLAKNGRVETLGPLIHNREALAELGRHGVHTAEHVEDVNLWTRGGKRGFSGRGGDDFVAEAGTKRPKTAVGCGANNGKKNKLGTMR